MERTIYLAGGCFWGIEHLMSKLSGVIDAESGYANGKSKEMADYRTVCTGTTGFRECVKVTYDDERISLDRILFSFFAVIHPEQRNRQGNDVGEQYQSGIYYIDEHSKEIVERIVELEKKRHRRFYTEVKPLENFYPAEEYHQDYLDRNPGGYCHVPLGKIKELTESKIDPGLYRRPEESRIEKELDPLTYHVTQEAGTERPFTSEYCHEDRKGIYVDKVTGEPLFSSKDKYESSCGWPSFQKVIEEPSVMEMEDLSHGMIRTEVRSRAGNSHLGHLFRNDPESPNGIRYCINGASLKFIPYEEMESEGYGYLLGIFD